MREQLAKVAPTLEEQAAGGNYGHRLVESEIEPGCSEREIRNSAAILLGNEHASVLARERELLAALRHIDDLQKQLDAANLGWA
jgi:hypothetical protein